MPSLIAIESCPKARRQKTEGRRCSGLPSANTSCDKVDRLSEVCSLRLRQWRDPSSPEPEADSLVSNWETVRKVLYEREFDVWDMMHSIVAGCLMNDYFTSDTTYNSQLSRREFDSRWEDFAQTEFERWNGAVHRTHTRTEKKGCKC